MEPQLFEKTSFYKSKKFGRSLKEQKFGEILKLEDKWTDNLFPPEDSSIYNGKTDFSVQHRANLKVAKVK